MTLPPGPSSHALIQTWHWLRRPFEFLSECSEKYGEVFQLHLVGFGHAVMVSTPELIKEIFAGDPEQLLGGHSNRILRPFVGDNSLLVLDGAAHQRQRRLLMPAFHGERMHAYGQTMLDFANESIDKWPLHSVFALHPLMQAVTLKVILRTILGVSEGARFETLFELVREGVEVAANPLLLFPAMQRELGGFGPWGTFMRMSRQVDEMLRSEIEQRRAEAGQVPRSDILSMLLAARDESGEAMSFQELRDELVTMVVAGHETTATALGWTMASLLRDEALCARLRAELRTAMEGGRLLPQRVTQLELLDATVREGLRLRPVAPMVGRVLTRPLQLGPYEIPAGWAVGPGIYLAHQRAAAFPSPERFDPDRYLQKRPTGNEWLPFGGGVRRCIGAAFATFEMKMMLAAILSRTELALEPGYEAKTTRRGVTLAPSDGVPVILSSRRPAVAAPAH